jgi:large subunit ribosomal protein L13
MKTIFTRAEDVKIESRLVDAKGKVLGRLATQIATYLMGKNKPQYTPNTLTGDFVVVINASEVRLTGNKEKTKIYKRYTGYQGGLREVPLETVRERHPDRIVTEAVRRMLPKTKLGEKMIKRLRVFGGSEHKHQAQKPVETQV